MVVEGWDGFEITLAAQPPPVGLYKLFANNAPKTALHAADSATRSLLVGSFK